VCQARIGTHRSSSDTFHQVRRPPPAAGGAWAKTEVFTKAGLLVGFMVVSFLWVVFVNRASHTKFRTGSTPQVGRHSSSYQTPRPLPCWLRWPCSTSARKCCFRVLRLAPDSLMRSPIVTRPCSRANSSILAIRPRISGVIWIVSARIMKPILRPITPIVHNNAQWHPKAPRSCVAPPPIACPSARKRAESPRSRLFIKGFPQAGNRKNLSTHSAGSNKTDQPRLDPNFLSKQIRMRSCSDEAKFTSFDAIDQ